MPGPISPTEPPKAPQRRPDSMTRGTPTEMPDMPEDSLSESMPGASRLWNRD